VGRIAPSTKHSEVVGIDVGIMMGRNIELSVGGRRSKRLVTCRAFGAAYLEPLRG
jgi:hypothetical protein